MLKYLRIAIASIVFLLTLAFFLDFSGSLPLWLHRLMHAQLVPALLAGMWVLAAVLLLSALLFGRLYCSILCPLGILQDVIGRCQRIVLGIRRKGKRKYDAKATYRKPNNWLRYGFLAAVVPLFFGITTVVLLLDPYSNFGRMATGLFKPVYVWGNNVLAGILNARGNFSVYPVAEYAMWPITIFAGVVLVILTVLVLGRGRLWCNTVCPLGTVLGFLSRYSIFGIRIDSNKCNHCNRCTDRCKAECIDQRNLTVDASRCVTCYNCIGTCNQKAIGYRFRYGKTAAQPAGTKPAAARQNYDAGRREFLKRTATSLAVVPLVRMQARVQGGGATAESRRYPLPPGAVDNFTDKCTACQLCVAKCPMQVLRPSYLERGLTGMMQPHMFYEVDVYCNYECTVCGDVCPTGAIAQLTVEEKKIRQAGIVHFVKRECIVHSELQDCGACAEHCPTGALVMVPFRGTLTIPQTHTEFCIGCGACESICPKHELAIYVEGSEPQMWAEPPTVDKQHEVEDLGFGF